MRTDGSCFQTTVGQSGGHNLRPVGTCRYHLGSLPAVTDAAADIALSDAMVGQTIQIGNMHKRAVREPPYAEGLCKMRTVNVGNLDHSVPIEISGSDRCQPAVRASDMWGRCDLAGRVIDGKLCASGVQGLDDHNFRRSVIVEIDQTGGHIFKNAVLRKGKLARPCPGLQT